MTREQKLDAIVAKIDALLEIASERTPGEWAAYIKSRTVAVDIGPAPSGKRPNIVDWMGFDGNDLPRNQNKRNAVFIASCAGAAEAGWIVTKSMIGLARYIESENMQDNIIAAWEGLI